MGLQETVLRIRVHCIATEVVAITAFEGVVVVYEVDCPLAFAYTNQSIGVLTLRIVKVGDATVHDIEFHTKVESIGVLVCIANGIP